MEKTDQYYTVGFLYKDEILGCSSASRSVQHCWEIQEYMRIREEDFGKFIVSWMRPDEKRRLPSDEDLEVFLTNNPKQLYWENGEEGCEFVHEAFRLFDSKEEAYRIGTELRIKYGKICRIHKLVKRQKKKWIELVFVESTRIWPAVNMKRYRCEFGDVEAVQVDKELYFDIISYLVSSYKIALDKRIAKEVCVVDLKPVIEWQLDGKEYAPIVIGNWIVYSPRHDGVLMVGKKTFHKSFSLVDGELASI